MLVNETRSELWGATVIPQGGLRQTYPFLQSLFDNIRDIWGCSWLITAVTEQRYWWLNQTAFVAKVVNTSSKKIKCGISKISTLDFILFFVLVTFRIVNANYSFSFTKVIFTVALGLNSKQQRSLSLIRLSFLKLVFCCWVLVIHIQKRTNPM